MNKDLFFDGERFISASRGAQITGYSNDYVGQLARGRKVDAKLVGRSWYVSEKSILEHKKNFGSKLPPRQKKSVSALKKLEKVLELPAKSEVKAKPGHVYTPVPANALPELLKPDQLAYQATKLHQIVAAILSLLIIVYSGAFVLGTISPKTADAFDVALADASSASVFGSILDFFTKKKTSTTPAPAPVQNIGAGPSNQTSIADITSGASTQLPISLGLQKVRQDLEAELKAYIASTTPRTVVGSQAPQTQIPATVQPINYVYSPVFKSEIIGEANAHTSSQSGSDVNAVSKSIASILTNGQFTNPTIDGGFIDHLTGATTTNLFAENAVLGSLSIGSSNGGAATIDKIIFTAATGTSATTTNFFSNTGTFDSLFAGNVSVNNGNFTVGSQLNLIQSSNGTTQFRAQRATDSAPSGDFITYYNAAGNTPLFRVDNSGNIFAGGISNSGSLTITSASTPQFRVQYDASNENTNTVTSAGVSTFGFNGTTPRGIFMPQSNRTDSFQFQDASGNSILNVDTTNQRVGIGTTTPIAKLAISNFGGTQPQFIVASSTGSSATTTSFIIDKFGNVGVGTANPQGLLHLLGSNSGNPILRLERSGNNVFDFSVSSVMNGTSAGDLVIAASNQSSGIVLKSKNSSGTSINALGIDRDGNVGIGLTNPAAKLDISDTSLAGSGSLTGSVLNLAQTWNTSGAPTAIKLSVTDTSSSASSNLFDLQVTSGSSARFTVDKTALTTIRLANTLGSTNNALSIKGSSGALASALTVGTTYAGLSTSNSLDLNLDSATNTYYFGTPGGNSNTIETIKAAAAGNPNVKSLKVQAGTSPTSGSSVNGGTLYLSGGDAGSTVSANGGNVYVYGGSGINGGTNGNVILAHDSTNAKGNVGIGVTNPATKLEVNGVTTLDDSLLLPNAGTLTNGFIRFLDASNGVKIYGTYPDFHFYDMNQAGDFLHYTIGGNLVLGLPQTTTIVGSSGFFGIGSSTPNHQLTIQMGSNAARGEIIKNTNNGGSATTELLLGNDADETAGLRRNSSANTAYAGASSLNLYQGGANPIGFVTSDALRAIITSAGNFGIGTTTPWGILSASSTSATPTLAIEQKGSGPAAVFLGGNVGINITNPNQKLVVNGNLVVGDTSGNVVGSVRVDTSNSGYSQWKRGDGGAGTSFMEVVANGTGPYFPIGIQFDTEGLQNKDFQLLRIASKTLQASSPGSPGTAIFTVDGSVGVGTTTPNNTLDLFNATTPALGFGASSGSTNHWTVGIDTADGGKFKISSSTAVGTNPRLTIDGSGNVGIGATNPDALLTVAGAITLRGSPTVDLTTVNPRIWRASGSLNFAPGVGSVMTFNVGSPVVEAARFDTSGRYLVGYTADQGGGQLLQVNSGAYFNGNVGIGISNPTSKLQVVGDISLTANLSQTDGFTSLSRSAGTTLQVNNSQSGYTGTEMVISQATAATTAYKFLDLTANSVDKFWVDGTGGTYAAGNVGIGITNPAQKLEVAGSVLIQNNNNLYFKNAAGAGISGWSINPVVSGSFQIKEESLSLTPFVINTSGQVGIGTTTPVARLDVSGTLGSQSDLFNVSSTTAANVVSSLFKVSANGAVTVGKNGSLSILRPDSGDTIRITASNANEFQFKNSAGSFVPLEASAFANPAGGAGVGMTFPSSQSIQLGVNGNALTVNSQNGVDIAGTTTIQSLNVGKGYGALAFNTAFGINALGNSAMTGNENTAIGWGALPVLTSGANNTALGEAAGNALNTGTDNVFLGKYTGISATSASDNVVVGSLATYTGNVNPLTTGNDNVIIGYSAGVSSGADNNSIVIGRGVTGLGSNTAIIGNGSNTKTVLTGNVGIGTTTPTSRLDVVGTLGNTGLIFRVASTTASNVTSDSLTVSADGVVNIGKNGFQVARTDLAANALITYNTSGRLTTTAGIQAGDIQTPVVYSNTTTATSLALNQYGLAMTTSDWALVNSSNTGFSYNQPNLTQNVGSLDNKLLSFTGTIGAGNATADTLRGLYTALTDNSSTANTLVGLTADVSGGTNTNASRYAALFLGGNVGIGTTSPQDRLHVYSTINGGGFSVDGTSNPTVSLKSNNTDRFYLSAVTATNNIINGSAANDIAFRSISGNMLFSTDNGSTAQLYLKNNGNVGIGTTNPGVALQIGDAAVSSGSKVLDIRSESINGATAKLRLARGGDTKYADLYWNATDDTFRIDTNTGTNALTIDTSQRVGIGTAFPATALDVSGFITAAVPSEGGFTLKDRSNNYLLRLLNDSSAWRDGVENTWLQVGNTAKSATIASKFSTSLLRLKLQASAVLVDNNNTSDYPTGSIFEVRQSHSPYFAVGSTGNVGVAVPNPASLFQVQGTRSTVTGTGDVTSGSATVTGTGTLFTSEVKVGDSISLNNEFHIVTSIASDTSLTVDANWAQTVTDSVTISRPNFVVTSAGNVGIGTSSPTNNFESWGFTAGPSTSGSAKNGELRLAGTTTSAALDMGIANPGTPFTWIQSRSRTNYATNNNLALNPNGGNVGIGTTNPGQALTVSGSFGLPFIASGAGTAYLCTTLATGVVSSSTTACNPSSIRFKDNVQTLSDARGLDVVRQLRPVTYTYKPDMLIPGNQLGFIAEEVYPLLPEIVGLDAQGLPANLDYSKLTPILTKAIQELDLKTGDIASTTQFLLSVASSTTARVDALELRVTALESATSTSGLALDATTTQAVGEGYFANASMYLKQGVEGLGSLVMNTMHTGFYAVAGAFDKVFAREVHTDLVCISDATGETCVTKAQLDNILLGSGQQGTQAPVGGPSGGDTGTSTPPTDNGGTGTSTPPTDGGVASGGDTGTSTPPTS